MELPLPIYKVQIGYVEKPTRYNQSETKISCIQSGKKIDT